MDIVSMDIYFIYCVFHTREIKQFLLKRIHHVNWYIFDSILNLVSAEVPQDPEAGQGHDAGQGQAVDPEVAAGAAVVGASQSQSPNHQTASPGPSHLRSQDPDQSPHPSPSLSPGPGLSLGPQVQETRMIRMRISALQNPQNEMLRSTTSSNEMVN